MFAIMRPQPLARMWEEEMRRAGTIRACVEVLLEPGGINEAPGLAPPKAASPPTVNLHHIDSEARKPSPKMAMTVPPRVGPMTGKSEPSTGSGS